MPTFKDRVTRFWEWYPQVASRFYDSIEEGQCENLVPEVGDFMAETLPEFAWAFGPGEDGGHSFTVSGEGVTSRQLLADYWLSRAPKIPNWTFYASRQPSSPEQLASLAIQLGEGAQVDTESFLLHTSVNEEDEVVDIVAWHPALEQVPEEHHPQILFLLLDEALGEFGVATWLGEIKVEPITQGEETKTIATLPEFIQQVAGYFEWQKPSPLENYALYEVPEQTASRRGDTVTGVTCIPHVLFEFLETEGVLAEDPLEDTGAEFVYVAIDGAVFPDGDESGTRANIEDKLSDALEQSFSGRALGGAFGTENSYIDLILYDGDNSRRIVQETLDNLGLAEQARIENLV